MITERNPYEANFLKYNCAKNVRRLHRFHNPAEWLRVITEQVPLIEKSELASQVIKFSLGDIEKWEPGCFRLLVDVFVQSGQVVLVAS